MNRQAIWFINVYVIKNIPKVFFQLYELQVFFLSLKVLGLLGD